MNWDFVSATKAIRAGVPGGEAGVVLNDVGVLDVPIPGLFVGVPSGRKGRVCLTGHRGLLPEGSERTRETRGANEQRVFTPCAVTYATVGWIAKKDLLLTV